MSFILKSGEAISKSQVNNSPSKQMFSFPKDERFHKDLTKIRTEFTTKLSDSISKRSTSFGFGKRSFAQVNKMNNIPFYDLPSSFNIKKEKFNLQSNHNQEFGSTINTSVYNMKPGPGAYNVSKDFGQDALSVTFKGRYEASANSSKEFPGPGQYRVMGLKKDGKYPSSNWRSTSSVSFGSPDSKRFKYIDMTAQFPGPGSYKRDTIFNGKNGFNFNSRVRSNNSFTFGKRINYKSPSNSDNHGPGQYMLPSDFGIYGGVNQMNESKVGVDNSFFQNFALFMNGFNSMNSTVLKN